MKRVQVFVRVRPPVDGECTQHTLRTDADAASVTLRPHAHLAEKTIQADGVFESTRSQAHVYRVVVSGLVDNVLKGINACVLWYGPTGAGKTYTCFGEDESERAGARRVSSGNAQGFGIVQRAVYHIFERLGSDGDKVVKMSYMQVYNDKIQDLLGNPAESLKLCETASGNIMYRPALQAIPCLAAKDIFELLEEGKKNKAVAGTSLNDFSSRAHTILRLTICPKDRCPTACTSTDESSFTFVDLAGSERAGRMKLTGQLLEEAKAINKSLSALGNVISALAQETTSDSKDNGKFVPWRSCKLTRMLSESLHGRCQTALVVCVSPS